MHQVTFRRIESVASELFVRKFYLLQVLKKASNPPKKQGFLQQINNNGINVIDFSLSQGNPLTLPHQPDCHNQNANFDSSFSQSLPVIPNFVNTENSIIPNPPFDLAVVVDMRQEFRQNGLSDSALHVILIFRWYIITRFTRRSNALQVNFLVST